jgi:TP901 family phage tail tape measure protein
MADINSNVRLDIDGSGALATLRELQRQISVFQSAMAKGNAANRTAATNLQKDLINNINATGQFAASVKNIKTSTDQFTTSLEKNKLSLGEYFRYGMGSTKTFGRMFKTEMATVEKVARERVKTIQTQYIKLGRDANGAMKSIAVRPLSLDMENLATKTAIAAQKQQIFNQVLKQGSTNLLNFGKNTQWAGRQLMVGFTIPLTMFATTAGKAFMDMEKQVIRLRRVYGDFNTTVQQTDAMVKSIKDLANEFTKYGVAVEKTMGLAADAAAMGKQGAELTAQVSEATRLAVLGGVEQAEALETTISLTNAFGTAADKLAGKINFLNSVENQTVTSIEDLTIAIPKAGPVVQQLGGDVEDLAFFLTAMREGGINASEGANALKSGLASLINPTAKASEFLQGFGVNIKGIVDANKGDIQGLVVDFASALDKLDPLNRARAIEQLFGKFQFSRLSTLFQNVIRDGSQASKVLELTRNSTEELAIVAERELNKLADSPLTKFQKSVEELKASLIPLGEQFLKIATPIIEFASKALTEFNKLSDGTKTFIVAMTAGLGIIGPVAIMTFGLLANGVANIIKGFAAVRNVFLKLKGGTGALGESVNYLTQEQLEALSVSASLNQAHSKLRQTYTSEKTAIDNLTAAYSRATTAQAAFAVPATRRAKAAPKKYASGVISVPGPKGAGDIVPAMLAPGEAVIPAKMAQKYSGFIQGMISGNIPGFAKGFLGMPKSFKRVSKEREVAKEVSSIFQQSKFKDQQPEDYQRQVTPGSGHSFPIFGLGGVYQKQDGSRVYVKPVMDDKAALAEIRATKIAREAHGLRSPEQKIVVLKDPSDRSGQRKFLALESPLDPTFSSPTGKFTKKQYFKQLLASLVRGDKDLSADNVYGDVLPDVGTAGVFSRASGIRDYEPNMPSLEDQAKINLLAVKGGAKKAFAESTADMVRGMTAQQYAQMMRSEIDEVLPKLRKTVNSMDLSPDELPYYENMIKRLEDGRNVDWTKYHEIHSNVNLPKQSKQFKKYNSGVVSVPGTGNTDTVPAMLTPGEAVIPKKYAKRYAPLINAMVDGKIPGFNLGLKTQKSHLQGDLDVNDPEVRKQILALYPNFDSMSDETKSRIKFSGSLVAELSDKMNQGLRERGSGIDPDDFERSWNGLKNKLAGTAVAGGLDPNDVEGRRILQELEDEIGKRAAAKARKDGVRVKDSLLAEITNEVLSEASVGRSKRSKVAGILRNRSRVLADVRGTFTGAEMEERVKDGRLVLRGQQVVDPATGIVVGDRRFSKSRGKVVGYKQKAQFIAAFGGYGKQKSFLTNDDILDADAANLVGAKGIKGAPKAPARTKAGDSQAVLAKALNKSSRSRSPSKKMVEATDNIVDGVEKGLEEGNKKVKKAATKLGETAADAFQNGGTKRVKISQSGKYQDRETGKFLSKEEAQRLIKLDSRNERARQRAAEAKATPTAKVTRRKARVGSAIADADSTRGYRPSKIGMVGGSVGMAASMVGGAMGNEAIMNAGSIALVISSIAEVASLFRGGKVLSGVKTFGNTVKTAFAGAKTAKVAGAGSKAAVAAGRAAAANAGNKAAMGIATRVGTGLAARLGGSVVGGPFAPILAGVALVTTALQVGVELFNEKVRTTAEDLRIFGDGMTTTNKELQNFAEATGQAAPKEIMDRMMGGKFAPINYAPGKTPFGEAYLQSDSGKAMLQEAAAMAASDNGGAVRAIGKDLSYAIVAGLLTSDQAFSIATALGKELDDYSISVGITGQIKQIVGLDGFDITKGSIDVPINLMITSNGKPLTDVNGPLQQLINTDTGLLAGADAWAQVQANEKDSAIAAQELVNGAQLTLDILDSEYLPKIKELESKGKLEEASKMETTYLGKRSKALDEYSSQYGAFMKSIQAMEGFSSGGFSRATGGRLQVSRTGAKQQNVEAIIENIQQNINTEFTGDENEPMRKIAEQIADDKQISGTAKITFLTSLKSGNMSAEDAARMFGKDGIFDPNSTTGQTNQTAYVDIFTRLNGRDATQFAGILENMGKTGVKTANFVATVTAQKTGQGMKDVMDLYSMIDQYGSVINAKATYEFLEKGDNLSVTMEKISTLRDLAASGDLNVQTLIEQKVLVDQSQIDAFKANQDYFSKLDPVQQVLYLQTMMTVQFDDTEIDTFISQNTKNGKYTDPSTKKTIEPGKYARRYSAVNDQSVRNAATASMAAEKAKSVTQIFDAMNGGNNTGGTPDPQGGSPDSSWLDDYVRRAKNALNMTQKLTNGFKASADAISKFKIASGGVGLEKYLAEQLKSTGLSPEMIKIISDLSPEEQAKFAKKYFKGGKMSKGLNADGEKLVKFERSLVMGETASAYRDQADAAQSAAKARDLLVKAGFDQADAEQLASDSQIAWALSSANTTEEIKKRIGEIKTYIETIQKSKTVEEQFAEMFDKALGIIGDRREAVEIKFEADTKGLEDGIRKAQDQIDIIVNEPGGIDDLQYGLDQIGYQEDEINKKYDKRLEALDKVEEARRRAIEAQRSEFELARAMASGDSSAAATAIQKFRADKASQAAESRRRIIEQARDNELKNVSTTVNGVKMTRVQIEDSILSKTKQIAKIEEESIEPARYRIQLLEDARDDIISTLVDQELKWKLLDAQIKNAAYNAWDYAKALGEANTLLGNTAATAPTAPAAPNNKEIQAQIDELNRLILITRERVKNETGLTAKQKADLIEMNEKRITRVRELTLQLNNNSGSRPALPTATGGGRSGVLAMASGGMVPKYFASGGFAIGTDTIPAMLTPGEFVMSKYAVSSFGADNLKAINQGAYKSDSVYNYEVNINVKSDADADQIARTVMTQLKQIDSQRVRGGRF